MSILKNKIAKALEKHQVLIKEPQLVKSCESTKSMLKSLPITIKPVPIRKQSMISTDSSSTCSSPYQKERSASKNVVKNYARAMINFALSDLGRSYVQKEIESQDKITLEEFKNVLLKQKEKVNSITTLRALLLVMECDNQETVAFKEVFKGVCETFVKLFSVNWIFSSKLSDRLVHLKYRFRILRRIKNPENFTYLENFHRRR